MIVLPADYALLSPEAAALPGDSLTLHIEIANDWLSLFDVDAGALSSIALGRGQRAIALQVNTLVELGTVGLVATSYSRGSRSWSLRDNAALNPIAVALAGLVLGAMAPGAAQSWPVITSVR